MFLSIIQTHSKSGAWPSKKYRMSRGLSLVLRWIRSYLFQLFLASLKRNSLFRKRTGSSRGEAHWESDDAIQQVFPPRGKRAGLAGGQFWSVTATDCRPGKEHRLWCRPLSWGGDCVVSMLYQRLRLSHITDIDCPWLKLMNKSWRCYFSIHFVRYVVIKISLNYLKTPL